MKAGRSLQELATEIERQQKVKQDFIAPTNQIVMNRSADNNVVMELGRDIKQSFNINNLAHGQLAEFTGIPKGYYDKMREESPELLATNVNNWLQTLGRDSKQSRRLVRVLDGNVRGLLSDRYRPLDNYDLAQAVLPVIQAQNLHIVSCEITDRRLYIKAFNEGLAKEIIRTGHDHIAKRDVCSPVICISNSEVGGGALSIIAGIFTRGCTNLAFFDDSKMRKYHVGKATGGTDDIQAVLTDQTKRLTDAAVWAQVRDIVSSAFSYERFNTLIERVQETTEQRIPDVVQAVKLTTDKFGLTQLESKGVLAHLIEGGDLSRYGLFNAVTRMSADILDYDRATEIERIGGKVIELPRNEWEQLAKAA